MVCTESEKEECIEIANRAVFLLEIIMCKGFWSDYYRENMPLMKKGIELMLNTIDTSILEKILYNYIVLGNYRDKEFKKNIIIFEVLMNIQEWLVAGMCPDICLVNEFICSLMGKNIDFIKNGEQK